MVLQQFEKRVPNKFFFYFIFDGSWCQRLDFMLFDCYDDGVLIKYNNKQFRLDFVLFLFFDRNDYLMIWKSRNHLKHTIKTPFNGIGRVYW